MQAHRTACILMQAWGSLGNLEFQLDHRQTDGHKLGLVELHLQQFYESKIIYILLLLLHSLHLTFFCTGGRFTSFEVLMKS